jgi:MFS family permease
MSDSELNFRSIRTAVVCSIGIMLASGTVIIGTFGIFMLPILHDYHWGRAAISGVVMTMSCTTALLAPLLGKFQDRWGIRRILIPGIVIYAATVMLLAVANGSIYEFYLQYLLVGVAATLISIVPYTKVVSEWFHRTRGLVLALVGVGVSIGASLIPQFSRILIGRFGWRGAYIGLGLLILIVNLPVQGFLLKEAPEGRRRPSPAAEDSPETLRAWRWTAPEIRRSRIYWTLIAIIFLTTFVTGGVMAHIVPMMRDHGISSAQATNALTIYILGGIAGRLLMGKLLDGSKSPRIAIPFYFLAVAGLVVLYNVKSIDLFVASGALVGVCGGAEAEFGPYLHSRYFGLRAFAETYGLQFLFLAVANGLGPVAMGAVFDATGSYQWMLAIHVVLLVAAATLFLSLRPYAAGASPHGITERISAPLAQE